MKEKDFEGRHREEKYHLKEQQKDWQLTSQQKSRKQWYNNFNLSKENTQQFIMLCGQNFSSKVKDKYILREKERQN